MKLKKKIKKFNKTLLILNYFILTGDDRIPHDTKLADSGAASTNTLLSVLIPAISLTIYRLLDRKSVV